MTFVCTCSFTISNIPAVSYRLSYRHSTLLTFTTLLSHPVVWKLKDTFESQTHIVRRVTEDLSCLSFFPNFVPYYFYLISLYAPFLSPSYSLFLFPHPLSLSFPSPSVFWVLPLSFFWCPFTSLSIFVSGSMCGGVGLVPGPVPVHCSNLNVCPLLHLSFCRYIEEEESSGSERSDSATACTSSPAQRYLSDGSDAPLSSALRLGSS